ncbi:MAG TPA: A/G-specific adenine glycosylase [Verrucomicrobiales bacterium]|nr:A/G-specific adenine glycosylase [Verrucomicrobiales bacterium]
MRDIPAAAELLNRPAAFRNRLITWFIREGRDDPWRQTSDPYAILVSEVMLQQTQVATVLQGGYFERWMQRFPGVQELAAAEEAAVLKAWEGLGYYRRAVNLQRTARAVVDQWGGAFPEKEADLVALPGIGRYTAGAIRAFAYNRPAAVVDANVARVLSRLFNWSQCVDSTSGREQLWSWAAKLVAPRRARLFNAGLMELGQRICLPRRPRCGDCPVRSFCRAEAPELLPLRRTSRPVLSVEEHAVFALRRGRILLQRPEAGRRAGLWKLPERPVAELEGIPIGLTTRYSITCHRVTLHVYRPEGGRFEARGPDERWVALPEVDSLPMGAPYRKVLGILRLDALGTFSPLRGGRK